MIYISYHIHIIRVTSSARYKSCGSCFCCFIDAFRSRVLPGAMGRSLGKRVVHEQGQVVAFKPCRIRYWMQLFSSLSLAIRRIRLSRDWLFVFVKLVTPPVKRPTILLCCLYQYSTYQKSNCTKRIFWRDTNEMFLQNYRSCANFQGLGLEDGIMWNDH